MTQFGRALHGPNIDVTAPIRAKSRVERTHKTLAVPAGQELRCPGARTMAEGNAILPGSSPTTTRA
jgi:hypothetical protein